MENGDSMGFFGTALEHLDKLNTADGFILFLIVVMAMLAIYLFFLHFTKKDKYLYGATLILLLLVTFGPLYFHETEKIPYNSSKDISNITKDLKCTYGGKECSFDTKNNNIECGYWKGGKESSLMFKYKKLQTRIAILPNGDPIDLDALFIVIGNPKFSTKGEEFSANFGLKSPLTNHMLSLKENKEINVSVCEKPCTAKRNTDSTYTIKEKRSEIETVFSENCKNKIFMQQNINGCSSHNEFDISVPLNNKSVYMKDNRYVFTGVIKQSSLPLYTDKKEFDTNMEIKFIDPSACFVLGIGESILKIENGIVSLDGKKVAIPNLNKDEPALLRVQKNINTISIMVKQEDLFGDPIIVECSPKSKNKVTFGYMLKSKKTKKKDVLSVYIEERHPEAKVEL